MASSIRLFQHWVYIIKTPVNTDTGGGRGVESVRINGVSVLSVQNLGKMYRLFLETKQTVRITTTR